jgi:hypothetical protein
MEQVGIIVSIIPFQSFLPPLATTWRKQVHPSFLLCRTFFLFGQCARRVFAEEKRWRCISYLIRCRMMKWNNKKGSKCAPNRRKSSPPFFFSLSLSLYLNVLDKEPKEGEDTSKSIGCRSSRILPLKYHPARTEWKEWCEAFLISRVQAERAFLALIDLPHSV